MENEIVVLSLCDGNLMFLSPDVNYRFEVNPNCKDCLDFAEKAKARQVKLEGED